MTAESVDARPDGDAPGVPGPAGPGAGIDAVPALTLEEFWSQAEPRLRRYAARQLRRLEIPSGRLDVDDVMQHTWIVLHDEWNDLHEPYRYMFTVARNWIYAAGREKQRILAGPEDGFDTVEDRTSPSVEEVLVDHELLEEVTAALGTLTPHQRAVVRGCDGEGRSRDEVAGGLGIAPGTVSSHRARGLGKLRAALGATVALLVVLIDAVIRIVRGRWDVPAEVTSVLLLQVIQCAHSTYRLTLNELNALPQDESELRVPMRSRRRGDRR